MNERSHCPYLGLRQNRAIRFASPTSEHRCYVTGEAQDIPVEQRTHCLSINHLSCPLYTGEWSGTTSGQLAGAGAMALPSSGIRGRLGNRDNIFYFVVVGLIFLITLVWVGIYLLYTFGGNSLGTVAVVSPTSTSTQTPPTNTAVPPTITATTDAAPPMPSGLSTASVLASGVTIDWEGSTEADVRGYNVYRSDSANGAFTKLNDGLILVSQYTDVQAPLGQDSFYRVTAVDRAGHESAPASIRINVPAVPPTATTAPTATATITPTATLAPTNAPPLEVTRVVPGTPVYIPVTAVPSRTSLPTEEPTVAPTSTDTPPTNTPEPTAIPPTPWPTPIPAPTDAPTPQPEPAQSEAASAPAATEIALTSEAPPVSAPPVASPTE